MTWRKQRPSLGRSLLRQSIYSNTRSGGRSTALDSVDFAHRSSILLISWLEQLAEKYLSRRLGMRLGKYGGRSARSWASAGARLRGLRHPDQPTRIARQRRLSVWSAKKRLAPRRWRCGPAVRPTRV